MLNTAGLLFLHCSLVFVHFFFSSSDLKRIKLDKITFINFFFPHCYLTIGNFSSSTLSSSWTASF